MKFLRFLLQLLLLVSVAAAVATALGFVPMVQSWFVAHSLEKRPELHLAVASLWARFGKIDAEGVRLEIPGGMLTAPTVEAEAPILRSLHQRSLTFHRLVAKGWTLDLRNVPKDEPVPGETTSSVDAAEPKAEATNVPAPTPENAIRVFNGLLSGWKLPCDFAADEIELEGDVLVPVGTLPEPLRIHVTLRGKGVGAGRKSGLVMTADGVSPSLRLPDFSAKGALSLSMDTPRTIDRITWNPSVTWKGGPLSTDVTLLTEISAQRHGEEENDRVALKSGEREIASLEAGFKGGADRVAGTWTIDVTEADVLPILASTPIPSLPVSGAGNFDTNTSYSQLHLSGHLTADAQNSGALTAAAGLVGISSADTHFDVVWSPDVLHVSKFSTTIRGSHPLLTLSTLRPLDYNLRTGAATLSSPAADWFEAAVDAVPLTWLGNLIKPWVVSSGLMTGQFTGTLANGGISIKSKTPAMIRQVSLQHEGSMMVRDLDCSIAFSAAITPNEWRVRGSPMIITSGITSLGELDVTLSRPHDTKYPLAVATKGRVDLSALSAQPGFLGLHDMSLNAVSGDLTTTFGQWVHFAGDVALTQRNSTQRLAAKLNADYRQDGSIVFRVPITMTDGAAVTELATQGSWLPSKYGHEVNGSIAGKDLSLDNLRVFGPLLTQLLRSPKNPVPLTGGPSADSSPAHDGRDAVPFWGDAVGRIALSFEHLHVGASDLQDVHANVRLERNGFHLEQARYQLSQHLAEAEAAISFDRTADVRYRVTGKFDDGEVNAEPLFGRPAEGQDPPFHGKFAVVSTLEGAGNTLEELTQKTQQRFQLKSTSGIVRFLKTHITGLTHEKESKLGDAADVVGTLVGKVAGVKQNSIIKGQVKLSKNTEAVLNFSYDCAEIGYSELTITAARGLDGALRVMELSMISPDEHLTGFGDIASDPGVPLIREPLKAELRFAVRDKTAELLAGSGLLSSEKDSLGYTLFKKPFRVTGSLQNLDVTEWHDLLFEAAASTTDSKKR